MARRPLGPGPGSYMLPTTVGYPQHDPSRYRNPMYSFGDTGHGRTRVFGPGPTYKIDRITREGPMSAPAWSFGARLPSRGAARTPGPGAHAPERCPSLAPRAPAYVMGGRLGYALRRSGPAPNAYAIRFGPGGPAYTAAGRLGNTSVKAASPGPAVYFQRDTDVYKTKLPAYSLGSRLPGGGRPTGTPGPAAYPPNLYNTKKNSYGYSFGTKHGDYAPPLIIKEDTMDCLD